MLVYVINNVFVVSRGGLGVGVSGRMGVGAVSRNPASRPMGVENRVVRVRIGVGCPR